MNVYVYVYVCVQLTCYSMSHSVRQFYVNFPLLCTIHSGTTLHSHKTCLPAFCPVRSAYTALVSDLPQLCG